MRRPNRTWCLLIVLLLLVPFALRALRRPGPRPQAVDAAQAEAGRALFTHVWVPRDPLAHGGDGLGPVFNAQSCEACHHQGGLGGSGGLKNNVTMFTQRRGPRASREGVVHAHATDAMYQETLAQVDASLPAISQPTLEQLTTVPGRSGRFTKFRLPFPRGVQLSQRNTPALFGARLIDELPEQDIIAIERQEQLKWGMPPAGLENVPVGRALRLANGRVGRFGWKAQTASLADFVQAACANELGLGNPGQAQPSPLTKPDYQPCGLDLTIEQCDQLTAFVASLPRPLERVPADIGSQKQSQAGKKVFRAIGCADCHTPDLGSVEGLYSDLLLHRMGQPLEGGGSYNGTPLRTPDFEPSAGPSPDEWRTPPLWGVADSGPYLHDGRAATLEEAIQLHGGQGARAAQRFGGLSPADQAQLIAFLKTLRAP